MGALLDIADLHTEIALRHGVAHAVNGVSLHVDEQETLGIVGESGCGKSMTALSIMRLLPTGGHITSGHVHFDGTDLVGQPESAMRRIRGNAIGMVFQDPLTSLNPTGRIGDQVAEAVLLHRNVSRAQAGREPPRCSAWSACRVRWSGWIPTRTSCPGGCVSG